MFVSLLNFFSKVLFLFSLVLTDATFTIPAFYSASPKQQDESGFSTAPCQFDLPFGVKEGEDVQCGFLIVPEKHADPDGKKIQLAVAIIKSSVPNPKPDPLVMAQGGPGASTIETYALPLLSGSRLRANRDIILFDQRGTFYSQPTLTCKEIDQLTLDTLDEDLPPDEYESLELDALGACRDRLIEAGVDLSAYNSLENAADIDALRQALGYEKINLYGVSYGTLLSLHTMREYPEGLRSVILDAVVPPQKDFILDSAQSTNRSFQLLFKACNEDPLCNNAFPNMENDFYALIDELNQHPATTSITDPKTMISYDAIIDGDTFLGGIFQMLYSADLIPALPRMIADAKEGNFEAFTRVLAIIVFDRTVSYGMYFSVLCAEDSDFLPQDQNLEGLPPQIIEIEQRSPAAFQTICKLWDVQSLDTIVDQPVNSDIPTLVLSGEFDPITPPAYAGIVSASLPNAFAYSFPYGSHGAALDGACQDGIILSFLDDPYSAPDSRCIKEIKPPLFYTPDDLLDLPIIIRLLNLDPVSTRQASIFLIALLIICSSLLVIPINFIARRASSHQPLQPQQKEPVLVRFAGWLPIVSSVVLSAFFLGLVVIVFEMIMKNDNRLLFGIPSIAAGWFFLPLIFFFLTLFMLAASILVWKSRAWTALARVYYSLLTLSGLICNAVLLIWGMFTTLM